MHDPVATPTPPPPRFPFAMIAGVLAILVSGLILTGWALGSQGLTSLGLPGTPMVVNSAVNFILSGVALLLLKTQPEGPHRTAQACAFVVGVCALLTAGEYVSGWNFGLDELLISDRYGLSGRYHGRMPPPTAIAFLLTAVSLEILCRPDWLGRHRVSTLNGLGLAVLMLGITTMLGYLAGFRGYYTWWQLKAMSPAAGLLFILLGTTVLSCAREKNGSRWLLSLWSTLGLVAGLTVVISLATYSHHITRKLAEATGYVQQSHEVISQLQQLKVALGTEHRNLYDYLTSGHADRLQNQTKASTAAHELLLKLRTLPADDSSRTAALARAESLIKERESLFQQLIDAHSAGGSARAITLSQNRAVPDLSDQIDASLDAALTAEERQLAANLAKVLVLSERSASILPTGLLLGTLLLIAGLLRINEETAIRNRIAEKLRHSEWLKSAILNTLPAEIALLNQAGDIEAVNEPWLRFARENGAPAEHLIGVGANYVATCQKAVAAQSPYAAEALNGIQAVMNGAQPEFQLEYPCPRNQMDYRWFQLHAIPLPQNTRGALVIHFDITARKQAEAALRKSEELYRRLLMNLDAGIVVHAPDTSIVMSNTRASEILGLSEDQLRGKTAIDPAWKFIHEDHTPLRLEEYPVNRVIKTKKPIQNQILGIIQPGRANLVWVAVNGSPSMDQAGAITEIQVSFIDITQRKQAEAQIRQLNAELEQRVVARTQELKETNTALTDFKAALDAHADVTITDREGKITYANDNFCALSQYSRAELLGHTHRVVNSHYHPPEFFQNLWQTITAGRVWHGEIRNQAKDGSYYWVIATIVPFRGPDGAPFQFIGIRNEITALKLAEAKILKLNTDLENRAAKLEAANKELEAFSYSVSHDLRAPLRAVDGFARMMIEDYAAQLDDNGRRMLNVIRDEALRMGHLIDDLLAFSRISRQQTEPVTIDMHALAEDVYHELMSAEPGRTLQFNLQAIPPALGTPAMIRQVWVNLISNALKFTRKRPLGTIEIGSAGREGDDWIYFIKDNGAGFDMRHAGKLFGVFQRLHAQPDFEGTGVGLALVQRILQRHGGRIWAEAEVDHGARFYFTLPAPSP